MARWRDYRSVESRSSLMRVVESIVVFLFWVFLSSFCRILSSCLFLFFGIVFFPVFILWVGRY